MGAIVKHPNTQPATVIDHEASLTKFYEYAEILRNDLNLSFLQKLDDFNNLIWEFRFNGFFLVLQFDTYAGISIGPSPWIEFSSRQNKELKHTILTLESLLLKQRRHV